jgi:hypothetical protein
VIYLIPPPVTLLRCAGGTYEPISMPAPGATPSVTISDSLEVSQTRHEPATAVFLPSDERTWQVRQSIVHKGFATLA